MVTQSLLPLHELCALYVKKTFNRKERKAYRKERKERFPEQYHQSYPDA